MGWNYRRLRMLHYKYQSRIENEISKLKSKFEKKYPKCIGTYDDCPKEINDAENPPEICKKCPKYHEWRMKKTRERKKVIIKGAYSKRVIK